MTDDTLRAALRSSRKRIRRWLDAEDLADHLAAAEGADSFASRDTSDVADHWLADVAAALATQPAGLDELRAAAVAMCNLWFTENAEDGSPHLRKAMLDLREALRRAYAEDQS